MKRRRRVLDVAPYTCGCTRLADMPAQVCTLCFKLTCPIHVHYLGHACPICPRCGYRHGEPVHDLPGPYAPNAGRRWLAR